MTNKITGVKLKELRKKHNMTLEEASTKAGMALSYLSQIENGTVPNLSFSKVMSLLKLYKIKVTIKL